MTVAFSDPRHNVLQLGLREGMKVADFGSGTGHYAKAAAGVVGASGKVYAVDIQEDVLKHARQNAHQGHHHVIEVVWGDIERKGGTKLRDFSMDAVMLANTLFQIEHRAGLVDEIKRVLKPEGKLLVIDWTQSHGGMGPHHEAVVNEAQAIELFEGAGFRKEKAFSAGPHHYGIVFSQVTT
jgi:ubiquinone/menaquinone biosynthesis C-methylase UbiE